MSIVTKGLGGNGLITRGLAGRVKALFAFSRAVFSGATKKSHKASRASKASGIGALSAEAELALLDHSGVTDTSKSGSVDTEFEGIAYDDRQ